MGKPVSAAVSADQIVPGQVPAVSLAGVEIFGQSVVERLTQHLRRSGVLTTVIGRSGCSSVRKGDLGARVAKSLSDRWSATKHAFELMARQQKRGTVLIAELGAYVEFDFADALQFHEAKGQPITPLCDDQGPLGYWIADASRLASAPGSSLPFNVDEMERAVPYRVEGYVNRLADGRDLRQLAVDGFLGRCSIAPRGQEIKPGVWIDKDVLLHKTARLVVPVYVGRNTKVEPAAVITRFSNLERHCIVGEGSVVTHTSILPHTAIGRGLDLSDAVLDGTEFTDLRRNITLKIEDPNLIGEACGKWRIPSHRHHPEELGHRTREAEFGYSQYLVRAASRFLEAFKGEA